MTAAAVQLGKTHCPHGHPYSGDNLIITVVKHNGVDTGKRKRKCRICKIASRKVRTKAEKENRAALGGEGRAASGGARNSGKRAAL